MGHNYIDHDYIGNDYIDHDYIVAPHSSVSPTAPLSLSLLCVHHVCVRVCVRVCMRACVRACMCACMRACVRARVRACMRARRGHTLAKASRSLLVIASQSWSKLVKLVTAS